MYQNILNIYQKYQKYIKIYRNISTYMNIYQQIQNPENVVWPDSFISTKSCLGDFVFRPISSFSWKASFRTDLGRSASKS